MVITMCHMLSTCVHEYMCSNYESSCEFGILTLYLNHREFRRKKHADKVLNLMSEKVEGLGVLTPKPTRAHTLDYNLNFCGTCLIDGECKDKAGDAEMAVLVLHSLDQLAYKEAAHSMMTTNNSFTIVQASKNMLTSRIETRLTEMPKFKFGTVKSLDPKDDPEAKNEGLQFPHPYTLLEVGFGARLMYEDDPGTMKVWNAMRSEQKSYLRCIMTAIDHICGVCDMPVKVIRQRHELAYTAGWMEPCFVETSRSVLKTHRPIPNQDWFIYSKKNLETEEESQIDANLARLMYDNYRNILSSETDMSPEVQNLIENAMKLAAVKAQK